SVTNKPLLATTPDKVALGTLTKIPELATTPEIEDVGTTELTPLRLVLVEVPTVVFKPTPLPPAVILTPSAEPLFITLVVILIPKLSVVVILRASPPEFSRVSLDSNKVAVSPP